MATTPPVPDSTKYQNIIAIVDNAAVYARDLVDALKKPNGKALARYKDLHALALQFKDAVNGLYQQASASDKSLQTGKRKEKPEKAEKAEKADKPDDYRDARLDAADAPKHVGRDKKPTRAERRGNGAGEEPAMTEGSSDDP